jgi:phenylalanyl-tRNA synthetase beta chain
MLELGQPLHAFDDAELQGAVHVRCPKPGEQLLLLNEQTVTPCADTALIADDEKPLALAGIMGGEHSEFRTRHATCSSRAPFSRRRDCRQGARAGLFVRCLAPLRARRRFRFAASRHRARDALILEICGGQPGPVVEAFAAEHLPTRKPVTLRSERAARVLGIPGRPHRAMLGASALPSNASPRASA